jgi:hypothetical protein
MTKRPRNVANDIIDASSYGEIGFTHPLHRKGSIFRHSELRNSKFCRLRRCGRKVTTPRKLSRGGVEAAHRGAAPFACR